MNISHAPRNFDGNAARKLETPLENEEELLEDEKRTKKIQEAIDIPVIDEVEEKKQIAQDDIDIPVIDEIHEKEEARKRLRSKVTTALAKEQKKTSELKDAQELALAEQDIMTSRIRAKVGLKQLKHPKERREQTLDIAPPSSIFEEGEKAGKEMAEIRDRRRDVSLEEARMLVPHGDRIVEFIEAQSQESPMGRFELGKDRAADLFNTADGVDHGIHYVRILGQYKRAVKNGNREVQREALDRLTRINRAFEIPMNALIEQALEKDDLKYVQEQIKMDAQAYAANVIKNASKEVANIPMTVDRVKKFKLVTRASDLWDNVAKMLPEGKENLATDYVLTLARVNEASRSINHVAYDQARSAFDKMSTALQIESRADIQSGTLNRPSEKIVNPFLGLE